MSLSNALLCFKLLFPIVRFSLAQVLYFAANRFSRSSLFAWLFFFFNATHRPCKKSAACIFNLRINPTEYAHAFTKHAVYRVYVYAVNVIVANRRQVDAAL